MRLIENRRKELIDNVLFQNIKNKLVTVEFPFRLIGAIWFGSTVKNRATPESDIDLLIVAENINSKFHRRGEEIAVIKNNLPPVPLDILLYTKNEVVSNFENHNPLFLDIAEEGEILFDENSLLYDLMERTREYIRQRGIQKLEDGWIFPVRQGIPTFLSKVSNKDFSLAMLTDGERDFVIGKKLTDENIFDKAVYHFQQAIEKSIKSILITKGIFKKTHFIGEVLRSYLQKGDFPKNWEDEIKEAAEISESLEPDVSLSRYPGIIDDTLWLPFEEYERVDAENAMEKAERVLATAKRFIDEWFSE